MSVLAAFMVPHPPMIVPAIGRGREADIQETIDAYERIADEIAALRPETIVITTPHSVMYSDYFHISPGKGAKGSFAGFGAPEVRFEEKYDTDLRDRICRIAVERDFRAGTLGERDSELDHGVMVPLWFIRKKYEEMGISRGSDRDFRILRIGLSGLPLADHYTLGEMISEAADEAGRRIVIVASGDLSHKLKEDGPYGLSPEGPEYDARIMDVCGRGAFGELFDFDEAFCEKAAECGHRSFVIMAGTLDGLSVTAKAYSHQDVTGVGYGICSFYPGKEDPDRYYLDSYMTELKTELAEQRANSDIYVRLARLSLETFINTGKPLDLRSASERGVPKEDGSYEELPSALLNEKAGAFVSIHKFGKLRGCIGTILPVESCLAEEIIRNAVSASTRDPRFDPIEPDELKWLEINVDVLGEPEDIDSPEELDVKRYGVIVSSGGRRGLLLPDLDGVDTVEQQISIAMQKGGIRRGEKVRLQRFEVVRHV